MTEIKIFIKETPTGLELGLSSDDSMATPREEKVGRLLFVKTKEAFEEISDGIPGSEFTETPNKDSEKEIKRLEGGNSSTRF